MKICGISDIHGNLLNNIPECDVLCIAGDVITLNAQRNFDASEYWWKNRFVPWVMKLPCKKVLVVPGNHDIYLEYLYNEDRWEEFCDYMAVITRGKLHFLIDKTFEYGEIKFYGTSWIDPIVFQENKWAFQVKDYKKDNPYSKIPNCDVLITHDSPFKNKHLNISAQNKCNYHLFGHWHEGYYEPLKGKYNCSRLDDYYSLKKKFEFPIINIEPMKETKYELLQKFAEEIKNNLVIEDLEDLEKSKNKIDEILIKFLDNPQDKEDEIEWNESSVITDINDNNEEYVDDEK